MMLDTSTTDARDDEARAILARNDRGRYTIPTSGLYPYQWNWDSAFAAVGIFHPHKCTHPRLGYITQ